MSDVHFALGTMGFGTTVGFDASSRLLDRFVDAGGTMLDTADCYAFWSDPSGRGGQSEELVGRWLARRPGRREQVYISTKVGAEPVGPGDWPANREGLSAPAIRAGVEGSLRRLGTDRIDLYWAHMEDRGVSLDESVEAFGALVAEGAVGRLGCSNHPVWRVERARQIARETGRAGYTALQLRHSYLQPRPGVPVPGVDHRFAWVTDEVVDYVDSEPELSLWVYTALLNGFYARSDRPLPEAYEHPGTSRRLAALDKVAGELGVSRNQVVLAWLIGGKPGATPIVGVSTPGQLDEALAGARLRLPDEHRRLLDETV
ncbi:aldo/keto reductase [Streptomyces poonensis]|uniref:Oxidoreductase n=1 Tax=Streptomyces poonensis TaxID=68255 RepID=A0A918PI03_9ACTN|nr:aldo/keto reductase [Streptomyces poonensis]GGZ10807.1 oxidoreductase [Streptomyces poonensis]GLJ91676.1 oxidoreductase [Streptomyces poonensis]